MDEAQNLEHCEKLIAELLAIKTQAEAELCLAKYPKSIQVLVLSFAAGMSPEEAAAMVLVSGAKVKLDD